ncbi:MAG: response regulator transcription factor [candidate division KSB1 bacterium]|nr:response regulator transcription factor [candidate division KSB1 bacterium]
MPVRALIVDDEKPARDLLKEYLQDVPAIAVIGECATGREAVKAINQQKPDLVFLDIQMPGLSGFEVLLRLEHLPDIIFTTAYDQYAIRAFEVNAIDYLLKPFSRDRFQKAVQRALEQRRETGSGLENMLSLLMQTAPPSLNRLFVRVGSRIIPIRIDDILCISAEGDYTRIHLADREYVCNLGIGALEKRLDAQRFVRVHRSYIIALPALKHLQSDGEGGYVATMINGARVRVSRSHAAKIRELIL